VRVLFTPLAWRTHYYPMVVLAWAARAAGHEVRVAAQPAIAPAIAETGMTPVTVGAGYDLMAGVAEVEERTREMQRGRPPMGIDELRQLPPEVIARVRAFRLAPHIEAARAIAPDLLAFADEWRPDVIVTDPAQLAGPLLAETRGIPLVRHMWGPDISRMAGFPGLGLPVEQWPEALTELYNEYGVRLAPEYVQRTIDPVPASLQVPGIPDRVAARYVPFNGPGELPEWLAKPGEPTRRVCVTWTTTARESEDEGLQLADLVAAFADLDAEIVLAVGQDPGIELPAGSRARLRVVRNLPLNLLLPTCSAIVHHGGAGTLLSAAYYGVPQVVVGELLDWVHNAELLAATGAGVALKAGQADPASIAEAVAGVFTDDATVGAAERLREEMRAEPSPAETVSVLESAAA
jgi:UDP:flavonoid glycosyltransferase YjiC (YdhE family)